MRLFFIAGSFLCIHFLYAQNQVSGVVKDARTQEPMLLATVTIPDLKMSATTDTGGHYILKNLPAGDYLVQAVLIGYASQAKMIHVSGSVTVDFSLGLSNTELQEIVVTGLPKATEQRKNPVPVSTLSRSVILQQTSTNLIDALTQIPGVSEITLGPSISKPEIRGLGYNRLVTMNDGVRQEGQQWFDEFGIEIDENSVSRVEVLKGPASLRYGSDAMAGVINFLQPASVPEGSIRGSVLEEYQTNNGLINQAINIAGNRRGFTWDLLSTTLLAHDYKNRFDGDVWNSGYSQNNLKGIFGLSRKWGYSRLALSLFNMKLGVIEGARDSATGSFDQHFLASNGSDSLGIADISKGKEYYHYPIIHQHIRHYKAVSGNSFLVGNGRLNVILGLQINERQEANDITKGDIYNNYFYLRTLNYDVQYLFPQSNKWDLSAGINGMQQTSQDRGIVFVLPEYHLFDAGAFFLAKKTFNRFSFSGGLREDIRLLHGDALYVDSMGARVKTPTSNALVKFSDYHSNFAGFSASVGIAYDFSKTVYGKINLSKGFRAPTAAESGQNGIHDGTPFYEIGDPNLKAESSYEADATLGISTRRVSVELTPFVNRINHYIFPEKLAGANGSDSLRSDPAAALKGPVFKYVAGDAVLSGGEWVVRLHPARLPWFAFDNSFSTVTAIQLHQNDSSKYLPYTPPAKFLSRVSFTVSRVKSYLHRGFLNIWVERYFEQDKIFYQFGNETITPGYTLLNASMGGDVWIKGKMFATVIVSANNLTDKAYQSNMSRLKYTDVNNVTNRMGVYNMGRNISFKLLVPFNL